jgi:hypothetical protein
MLTNSLGYFYYYVPGPDSFFLNLAPAYLSNGFTNPQATAVYAWPGLFLLTHILSDVTTLPLNVVVSIFYFSIGFVLASMVFFIVTRHGLNGFWGVVAFSIIGFFFLNYQFAPQTLGLAFVMILLYIDYAWGKSQAGMVMELTLVVATALSHPFMLLYYAAYLFTRTFRTRRYLTRTIFSITVALVVNLFLAYPIFSENTLRVFSSLQNLLGLTEYQNRVFFAVAYASPFETFSRLAVLSAMVVSGLGLIGLFKSRRTVPQDTALVLMCALMLGVGAAVTFLGTRAIQLALVVAGIGSGHFPKSLHRRKIAVGLLLFLSISSIFNVMHLNYRTLLYQPQEDAQAARFLSATIDLNGRGPSNPLRIFTPYVLRGFFGLSDTGNASIEVFFSFVTSNGTSKFDYVLAPTATPAFAGNVYITMETSTPGFGENLYLVTKTQLLSKDNLIFNYGDGVIYAAI